MKKHTIKCSVMPLIKYKIAVPTEISEPLKLPACIFQCLIPDLMLLQIMKRYHLLLVNSILLRQIICCLNNVIYQTPLKNSLQRGLINICIVAGRKDNGSLLVIHCAAGANNVVITSEEGFGYCVKVVG